MITDCEAPKSCSSLVLSILLGSGVLASTLFWRTNSLCFSFKARDQVWHPYNNEKNYSFYIYMFSYLVTAYLSTLVGGIKSDVRVINEY